MVLQSDIACYKTFSALTISLKLCFLIPVAFYQHAFHHIFYVLHNEFPQPGQGPVCPALRVKGKHNFIRQPVYILNNLLCSPEIKIEAIGYLIPNTHIVTIPAAACIREIGYLIKIHIQVWLPNYSQFPEVIFLPQRLIIVPRPGAAMHADGIDGTDFP